MLDILVQWVSQFDPYTAVALLAMLPVSELRGAIPVGLVIYNLPIISTYSVAVLANMIPPVCILYGYTLLRHLLISRQSRVTRLLIWFENRTRNKFHKKYELYGEVALMLFVAIPLPITGAWTGSLAALLFGIPTKKALIFITIGVLISGIIVTGLTTGALTSLLIFS